MKEQCLAIDSDNNEEEVPPKGISPYVLVGKINDDDGRITELY